MRKPRTPLPRAAAVKLFCRNTLIDENQGIYLKRFLNSKLIAVVYGKYAVMQQIPGYKY